MMDCDQLALGEAAYGPGQRARAVLLDQKVAVVNFLLRLDESRSEGQFDSALPGETASPNDEV